MTVVLRRLLNAAAVCWSFFPGTALRAAELTDSELPAVATDSQPNLARAPEARARSRDERWLNKPYHVGLSTILGRRQGWTMSSSCRAGSSATRCPTSRSRERSGTSAVSMRASLRAGACISAMPLP